MPTNVIIIVEDLEFEYLEWIPYEADQGNVHFDPVTKRYVHHSPSPACWSRYRVCWDQTIVIGSHLYTICYMRISIEARLI